MDQWSGYPAAQARLLNAIARSAPNRTVVLTGDIHTNWVNELRTDFRRAERPPIAAEFVGTSISSGGDGSDATALDAEAWTMEYRTVAYVSRPDAPVETPTRWRVTRGRSGIERA